MDNGNKNRFQFGDFELDAYQRTLRHQGEIMPLQARVFDVLCMLVERRGGVVSKDELMETIWAGSFVEESNITQSIYSLRKLLDRNGGKSMIETVPKRGYRMATPVNSSVDRRLPVEPVADERPSVRSYRVSLVIAVGLILLTVFAASGYIVSRYFNPTRSAPVESVKFEKLTFSGDIAFPIIAPDGKAFAFVRDNAIHLQDVANGSSVKLAIAEHQKFGNLQFSAEGESIYFRDEDSFDASGNLYQVSRFGGQAKLVAEKVWSTPGFASDSKHMAFIRFSPTEGEWALIIRDAQAGNERKLFSRNLPTTIYRSGFPAFSPDGKRIAIVEQTADQGNASRIVIVDIATGQAEQLPTSQFVQIEQLGWLPDGQRLLVTGRENNRFFQLWQLTIATGEVHRITNDLNIYRNLSVSSDGKRLLARQYSLYSHIWTAADDDLAGQKQITFGNLNRDGNSGLRMAPDGNVVYSTRITGNTDVWTMRISDGVRRQLTDSAGTNNENPFVTADGNHIFFESTRSGRRKIWRMSSDGSDPVQITTDKDELDFLPVSSPDGRSLYYISRNPRSNVLWRQSLEDGSREMLTQQGKVAPEGVLGISPTGDRLMFRTLSEGSKADTTAVCILDLATRQIRNLQIDAQISALSFSDRGESIDYVENTPTGARIWRRAINGESGPNLLAEIPRDRIFAMSWSIDGKTLAVARGRQDNDAILLTGF